MTLGGDKQTMRVANPVGAVVLMGMAPLSGGGAIQLDGERGPRVVLLQSGNLPGEIDDVRGVVSDSRGHDVARARQLVFVLPSGREQ
jgi:hypothetical protein